MRIQIISNSRMTRAFAFEKGAKPVIRDFPPDTPECEIRKAFDAKESGKTDESADLASPPESDRSEIIKKALACGIPSPERQSTKNLLKEIKRKGSQ